MIFIRQWSGGPKSWGAITLVTTSGESGLLLIQAINFCGHNEIALGQAIDFVSPQCYSDLAPPQQNVGMMSLLFGERANPIYKVERLFEIGELEFAAKVMFRGDRPCGNAPVEFLEFLAFERRNTSAARYAVFVGKLFAHIASQGLARVLA